MMFVHHCYWSSKKLKYTARHGFNYEKAIALLAYYLTIAGLIVAYLMVFNRHDLFMREVSLKTIQLQGLNCILQFNIQSL